jgi:hypothetical protein
MEESSENSVSIVALSTDFWTEHLQSTSQKCYTSANLFLLHSWQISENTYPYMDSQNGAEKINNSNNNK